ncbi:hypothetical protein D3C71_1860320 [compost metagenome]
MTMRVTGVACGVPVACAGAAPAVCVPASAGTVAEAAPAFNRPRREICKASWLVMGVPVREEAVDRVGRATLGRGIHQN